MIVPAGLGSCIHERGSEREVQFHHRVKDPILPVLVDGELKILRWGNSRGGSRKLPRTGHTWQSSLEEGKWTELEPQLVEIPAALGFDRGVWFHIRQGGIRGILVQ